MSRAIFNVVPGLFLTLGLAGMGSAQAVDLPMSFYGKINMSYDSGSNVSDDWSSNASRLGLKGEYSLNDKLAIIYQLEQEVDYAHGGKQIDTLFGMRSTFVGVKGGFGSLFFGANDSPFKLAQAKVDLFNDQIGDIKNLMVGEVRPNDTWHYASPKMESGLGFRAAYIPADDNFKASTSLSVSYAPGDLYLGFAMDSDVRKNDKSVSSTKVYDSLRAVGQYKMDNWQFGLLLQSSERQMVANADQEFGYSVSVSRKLNDFTLKLQHGASDIVATDVTSTLIGVDYKVAKNTKVYAYYWDYEKGSDKQVASVGFEYKF